MGPYAHKEGPGLPGGPYLLRRANVFRGEIYDGEVSQRLTPFSSSSSYTTTKYNPMSSHSTSTASDTLKENTATTAVNEPWTSADFDQGKYLELDFTAWELAKDPPAHPDVEVEEFIPLSKNWCVKPYYGYNSVRDSAMLIQVY
jgi:hypothetical protein